MILHDMFIMRLFIYHMQLVSITSMTRQAYTYVYYSFSCLLDDTEIERKFVHVFQQQ